VLHIHVRMHINTYIMIWIQSRKHTPNIKVGQDLHRNTSVIGNCYFFMITILCRGLYTESVSVSVCVASYIQIWEACEKDKIVMQFKWSCWHVSERLLLLLLLLLLPPWFICLRCNMCCSRLFYVFVLHFVHLCICIVFCAFMYLYCVLCIYVSVLFCAFMYLYCVLCVCVSVWCFVYLCICIVFCAFMYLYCVLCIYVSVLCFVHLCICIVFCVFMYLYCVLCIYVSV